jgi:hypothetical protein
MAPICFVAAPRVVVNQICVFPARRRQVLKQLSVHRTAAPDAVGGTFKVNGVPENGRAGQLVEDAGAVPVLLEPAIADLARTVEEPSKRGRENLERCRRGGGHAGVSTYFVFRVTLPPFLLRVVSLTRRPERMPKMSRLPW